MKEQITTIQNLMFNAFLIGQENNRNSFYEWYNDNHMEDSIKSTLSEFLSQVEKMIKKEEYEFTIISDFPEEDEITKSIVNQAIIEFKKQLSTELNKLKGE